MSSLRQELKEYGFFTKKSLGQNFIFDENILRKIADGSSGICLEIGPGPGGLTRELCKVCDRVVAIEIDSEISQFLNQSMTEYENFSLINDDFMKLDLDKMFSDYIKDEFIVVANLPYYITTPVLMKLIDSDLPIKKIRVLVQKEVAQRIKSTPGSKDYGVLSVMVQCRANAKILFDLPPHVFTPAPSVTSSVIEINISEEMIIKSDINEFRKCVRSGFSNRRKQMANNIAADYNISKEKVYEILESIGLKRDIRAEKLSVQQFDQLCYNLRNY
ncbi:MAG: 16S rRNA (adenine(1518)-N(6)/adenine(1519)-N(6))-dimethyltransferase RsmA [Eubacteriales bacterium]